MSAAKRKPRPRPKVGAFDHEKALARGKSRNACIAALALMFGAHLKTRTKREV